MRTLFSRNSLSSGTAASRCNRLLIFIIALIAVQPFFTGTLGRIVVGFTFIAVISQGAVALADERRHRLTVRVLGAAAALAMIVHVTKPFEDGRSYAFVPALLAVFGGYVGWTLLGFVVQGKTDVRTRLSAALCVYLLAGLTWSMAYVTIHLVDTESFAGAPIAELGTDDAFRVFTYFSYVTLTTLGYGEITPVSSAARTLVMLEAIGGVLYIAVMVASLVGTRETESAEG